MTNLFTIGYEGLTIENWLRTLLKEKINLIVDVREMPISRKKGFSKNAMTNLLNQNGIAYIHIKELGSPGEIRKELYETGDYSLFFSKYKAYLNKQRSIVSELIEVCQEKNACLLCFERKASQCHRSVITEKISEVNPKEVRVRHL